MLSLLVPSPPRVRRCLHLLSRRLAADDWRLVRAAAGDESVNDCPTVGEGKRVAARSWRSSEYHGTAMVLWRIGGWG